jgi:uncharacterized protein (TIGR03435 family)
MGRWYINRIDSLASAGSWPPRRAYSILMALYLATFLSASGQTAKLGPGQLPFEVVSVRPSSPGNPYGRLGFTADGYIATNASLLMIIRTAYGYSIERRDSLDAGIAGVPNWAKTENFDIAAKIGDADLGDFKKLTDVQRRQLLQEVLADRFKLSVHLEERQVLQYALVPAKNGPRVAVSKVEDPGAGTVHWSKNGLIDAKAISISGFDQIVSQIVGRTVQDRTGLTGEYDLHVQWVPDAVMPQPPSQADVTPVYTSGASFFTALQEQLGLKLESTKGPEQTLVVDHVQRPSPN